MLAIVLLFNLFAFPALKSLKTRPMGKIFAPTKNFAQFYCIIQRKRSICLGMNLFE